VHRYEVRYLYLEIHVTAPGGKANYIVTLDLGIPSAAYGGSRGGLGTMKQVEMGRAECVRRLAEIFHATSLRFPGPLGETWMLCLAEKPRRGLGSLYRLW
jgi:hypothetical protein